jgi:trimeric autotransporter adhesin
MKKVSSILATLFLFTVASTSIGTAQSSNPTLVSMSVTPQTINAIPGDTDDVIVTGAFSDGSTQDLTPLVTWSVGDPDVLTVSAPGTDGSEASFLVTSPNDGMTTLTAIYTYGCPVCVSATATTLVT